MKLPGNHFSYDTEKKAHCVLTWPAMEQQDRNGVGSGREEPNKVDIEITTIKILDMSLEIWEGVHVFLTRSPFVKGDKLAAIFNRITKMLN